MRLKYSKLTDDQTAVLLDHFIAGTPARTAADEAKLNRNTVRDFYHKLREIIAWRIEAKWTIDGEIEVEEAYFGPAGRRKEASGESERIALFGIVGRGGRFNTKPILDSEAGVAGLPPIQQKKILPDSIVYATHWNGDGTVDIPALRHRIYRNWLIEGRRNRSNEIAEFWNRVKEHLGRYNGIPRNHFNLFLKECEWRINFGPPEQTTGEQLVQLRRWIRMHNEQETTMKAPPGPPQLGNQGWPI